LVPYPPPPPPTTLGTLLFIGLLAGLTLPLVGSLAACGGGGHEAHSGPSTPIGIKFKRKAVGIQVKKDTLEK